jgi:hypothetical protein
MVIVAPAGHASARLARSLDFNDDFVRDLVDDIMAYAETHYRVLRNRQHRDSGTLDGWREYLNKFAPQLFQ